MTKLALIVEGDGEVTAARLLARRIIENHGFYDVELLRPIRIRKDQFVQSETIRNRYLTLAREQVGPGGKVIVLVDSDDACPREFALDLLPAMQQVIGDVKLSFVMAKREFEAWIIAAAGSVAGCCGLPADLTAPGDPEGIGSPKAWLRRKLPRNRGYSETVDQQDLAARFDWQSARAHSPSLDKFCREVLAGLA